MPAPPSPPLFAPSSLAQWFSAVGTIGAVILALFRDALLVWLRKPKLEAVCSKESPWTHKTPISINGSKGPWTGEGYFVRLEVKNAGHTRAEKVQVYAKALSKVGRDNAESEIKTFLPLNLKWANSPPDKPITFLDGISPKMAAFCDVLGLSEPSNPYQARPKGTSADATVGQLQLEVDPFSGFHLLPPGKYRLTLLLAAANVKPAKKIFEFEHTGQWIENEEDMRRDCLSVSLR